MMARLSRAGWRTLSSLLLETQFGRACDKAVGGRGRGGLGGRAGGSEGLGQRRGAVFGADSDTFTHDLREWGPLVRQSGEGLGYREMGGEGREAGGGCILSGEMLDVKMSHGALKSKEQTHRT